MSKIYILCPVRNMTEEEKILVEEYIEKISKNNSVHSYKNVEQNCETGASIVLAHQHALVGCDEVHVFWNHESSGSHFDLGMAYALQREIKFIKLFKDNKGKSYYKALNEILYNKIIKDQPDENILTIANNQKPLNPEIQQLVDENFWKLLSED